MIDKIPAGNPISWIKIHKRGGGWKMLPHRCASLAQAKGILARYKNPSYEIIVKGKVVERRMPYRGGFAGKIDQAGIPTLGRTKP
jgi:hypothetical protein